MKDPDNKVEYQQEGINALLTGFSSLTLSLFAMHKIVFVLQKTQSHSSCEQFFTTKNFLKCH